MLSEVVADVGGVLRLPRDRELLLRLPHLPEHIVGIAQRHAWFEVTCKLKG